MLKEIGVINLKISSIKSFLRSVLSTIMISMGVLHVLKPTPFVHAMPTFLPHPLFLVLLSGLFEIAGGFGLWIPRFRMTAGWGLVVLYVAVFPANVWMAFHAREWGPAWILWLRLPFQIPLVAWAYWLRTP